jgi:methylenetetrahydrofolate dehydrogenase (NADP+)/methenyltetrahydrofolate cyclohydrolase
MILLNGKETAQALRQALAIKVQAAQSQGHPAPHLAAVLVGNNPASEAYVRNKMKACAEVGFRSSLLRESEEISQEALLAKIKALNEQEDLDGYIVQLPLPKHIDEQAITLAIAPEKDADGFHPYNVGLMTLGQDTLLPATPYGILLLLEHYGLSVAGKHCVIVGRSNIVGRPMSILLSDGQRQGTVSLCHSRTPNLPSFTLQADVLVAAIGKPNFITADMVKPGAIVIDVGINAVEQDGKQKLVGDVDFEAVSTKASALTPVPGGVGPMTILGLLYNTWHIYEGKIKG